jgi:hypothetical protein
MERQGPSASAEQARRRRERLQQTLDIATEPLHAHSTPALISCAPRSSRSRRSRLPPRQSVKVSNTAAVFLELLEVGCGPRTSGSKFNSDCEGSISSACAADTTKCCCMRTLLILFRSTKTTCALDPSCYRLSLRRNPGVGCSGCSARSAYTQHTRVCVLAALPALLRACDWIPAGTTFGRYASRPASRSTDRGLVGCKWLSGSFACLLRTASATTSRLPREGASYAHSPRPACLQYTALSGSRPLPDQPTLHTWVGGTLYALQSVERMSFVESCKLFHES